MAARPRKKVAAKRPDATDRWREDGDVLDVLAGKTAKALASGKLDSARAFFAEYRELLLRHLAHEEDVTFPLAEKRAPSKGGPIKSLRVAHIGMRRDLESVANHLELGHTDAARAVFGAFLESFASHERLEDQLALLLRKSQSSTGPVRRSR